MIIVLFIIFLLMIGIGYILQDRCCSGVLEFIGVGGVLIGFIAEFIIVSSLCMLCFDISQEIVINDKIEMYENENANIEKEITTIVNSYKDYEKEIISNVFDIEVMLINIPELKSSELVQTQMNIYVENNNKIKQLKEDKLNYSVSKWWLYFGGK